MQKKVYTRPVLDMITLDNTISLQMQSGPKDPPPRGGDSKGTSDPFSSPFGDRPFG